MRASQTSFFSDEDKSASETKLVIKNLGPIERCELNSASFTVLAGCQASNISVVAKCIYFFRTVKDVLQDVIVNGNPSSDREILDIVSNRLLMKFRVMFEPRYYSNALMRLAYSYSDHVSLEVMNIAGELRIFFSPNMVSVLKSKDLYALSSTDLQYCLNTIFNDEYDCVFIPAERCITSVLSRRLIRLCVQMANEGEEKLDYCMVRYMERILQTDESRDDKLVYERAAKDTLSTSGINKFINIASTILGEDYISMKNASADSVRLHPVPSYHNSEMFDMINVLFGILISNAKAYIIVEEPESQLCPELQYEIVTLLALLNNAAGSKMLITTRSPYILNSLSASLCSYRIEGSCEGEDPVIDKLVRINPDHTQALTLDEGISKSVFQPDDVFPVIDPLVVDGVSERLKGMMSALEDKHKLAGLDIGI